MSDSGLSGPGGGNAEVRWNSINERIAAAAERTSAAMERIAAVLEFFAGEVKKELAKENKDPQS